MTEADVTDATRALERIKKTNSEILCKKLINSGIAEDVVKGCSREQLINEVYALEGFIASSIKVHKQTPITEAVTETQFIMFMRQMKEEKEESERRWRQEREESERAKREEKEESERRWRQEREELERVRREEKEVRA